MILGIFLGNWMSAMRFRSMLSNDPAGQHFSIRPGNGGGQGFSLNPKTNKLNAAIQYISNEYVDTVDMEEINEVVLPEILEELDPHSVYFPPVEFQMASEPLIGNFSGIGVTFNMVEDTVAIIGTIPNGPSERVGILAGDRIVQVDDSLVAGVGMPSNDIVRMLKGPKNTEVRVSVHRKGKSELLDFEITRDDIPLYSVDVAYMVNEEIGYIKISQFAQTTYREFMQAIEKLKSAGSTKLIIDLRQNGGGIMEAATMIADQFLEANQLIVYTEGRSRPRENEYSSARGVLKDDEVVILTDESSASASEILAGALQDNDRGLIVGRRTFGKGLVQEEMRFTDGSAIRLTVARFYTPTGRAIQRSYENGLEEYYHDYAQRIMHGELEHEDSIKFDDEQRFITPGGRVVYGGGGIMPDVFVPVDTTAFTNYYSRIRSMGLMYRFGFYYTDLHREKMLDLGSADKIESYLDELDLMKDFISYAKGKGVMPNWEDIRVSEPYIHKTIKAYIARNLIDNEGFYPIIADIDNTLQVAIDTLSVL